MSQTYPYDLADPDDSTVDANQLGAEIRQVKIMLRDLLNQIRGVAETTAIADPFVDSPHTLIGLKNAIDDAVANSVLTINPTINKIPKKIASSELGDSGLTDSGTSLTVDRDTVISSGRLFRVTTKNYININLTASQTFASGDDRLVGITNSSDFSVMSLDAAAEKLLVVKAGLIIVIANLVLQNGASAEHTLKLKKNGSAFLANTFFIPTFAATTLPAFGIWIDVAANDSDYYQLYINPTAGTSTLNSGMLSALKVY